MKQATVFLHEKIKQENLIVTWWLTYMRNATAGERGHSRICWTASSIHSSHQNFFNFRCELDGEYSVGNNWAETH